MHHARILVCERDGKWAAWMRGGLPAKLAIYQLRNLDQCNAELSLSPFSAVCLEATPHNVARIVDVLIQANRSYPDACLMVVAERAMRNFQWTWRVAGAVHVAFGYDQSLQAARIAQRHLSSAAELPQTFRQKVLNRIPW